MAVTTLAMLALAFSLDLLVGTPRNAVAPVGRLVDRLSATTTDRRGIVLAVSVSVAALAGGAVHLGGRYSPTAASAVAAVVLSLAIDLRALLEGTENALAAVETGSAGSDQQPSEVTDGDEAIAAPAQRRGAVLASGADRLSTDLLATLLPFSLLAPASAPAAAGVAAWVRCILTLDTSNGGGGDRAKPRRGAVASAVAWLPDRIAAGCIAVTAGDPAAIRRARRQRRTTSNSVGWSAATLAAALDVRFDADDGTGTATRDALGASAEQGRHGLALLGLAAAVGVVAATLLATVGALVAESSEPVLQAAGAISAAPGWSFTGVGSR